MITLSYFKRSSTPFFAGPETRVKATCETCGFSCSSGVSSDNGYVPARMLSHLVLVHGFEIPELQRNETESDPPHRIPGATQAAPNRAESGDG
jgi:hypothetical protein